MGVGGHTRTGGAGGVSLRASLLALALLGAVPPAAGLAQAPLTSQASLAWSPPATIAAGGPSEVLFAPGGAGAVVWPDGLAPLEHDVPGAPRPYAGARGHANQNGSAGLFATYGSAHLVSLEDGPHRSLRVLDASLRTGKAAATTVAGLTPLDVAANAKGEVAALVERCDNCTLIKLSLGVRPAGTTRFTRWIALGTTPNVYGDGTLVGVVAVARSGAVLTSWVSGGADPARYGRLVARVLLPTGTLTPAQTLGGVSSGAVLAAGFTADDRPLVAWESELSGEGCYPHSPVTIGAAVGSASGTLGRAQGLERFASSDLYGYCVEGEARLVALVGGAHPWLAWTGRHDGRFTVRAAALVGSRFTHAQTLSRPDADRRDQVLLALAGSSTGQAVAMWASTGHNTTNLQGGYTRLKAAEAPSGGPFGAPQALAGRGDADLSLAVDPRSGHAVAVWDRSYVIGR